MVDEIPLTREQLYEEVWTEPMTKVSSRLGLSDVGLAKICRGAAIPTPPRGYWAKKRNGEAVRRARLPKLDKPIDFVFRPPQKPPASIPTEPEYDEDVRQLIAAAKLLPPLVPKIGLSELHPLVERTRRSLARCKSDERQWCRADGLLHPEPCKGRPVLEVHVSRPLVDRALLFLDALLRGVESIGGKVKESKEGTPQLHLYFGNEYLGGIVLAENRRQIPNPDRTEDRLWRAKTALAPGGLLKFESTTVFIANRVHDTPKHKIESQLNKLVVRWAENVGRQRLAKIKYEERRQREAEEERIREQEDRRRAALRYEYEKQQRVEQERIQELKQEVAFWEQSRQIREYVGACRERAIARHGKIDSNSSLDRWCRWALWQADRLDPLAEAKRSVLDLSFEDFVRAETAAATAPSTPAPPR